MKRHCFTGKQRAFLWSGLALLALPPLAVYGQTVRCRAAQPRPALPGVMSDEIRQIGRAHV